MPIYEYKCTSCKHHFEIKQSIHDKSIDICPKCKGKVQKIIGSNIGIAFKGSGFYVTDSKHSKKEHKKTSDIKTDHKPKDAAKH